MVPDRTDKIENSSAQTAPSATSTMTSPLHADDNSSPSMSMQSPSPSKKRPRRGVNGSRYSKRRRLSQCSLSPDVVGTRTRSKNSIPTKLDDMESWCTLLSYIDDFVSRKFITEQQGRELRKLVRYKDKELKNLYNSVDKAKNEKDLLSLFKLAHERCPKLSSPFVPTTPNSLSSDQAGFSSPPTMYQATPPLSCDPSAPLSSMDQNVAATNHDENNHNKNTNKNENNTPHDENTDKNNRSNDNYTQVPSMQDILQQLSHLDTGFAETPIQDTSSFLEKNQFHENSPNSKTIQQHLQAQRPQKRNQQDATVTERSSAYNELSESELYYLLMSELHKTPPNQYTSEELSPSPVPHANSITIESNYNDTTQQNFDPTTTSPAASYQDFCNLFGFQSTSSSAPTPFQTPTSSSQAGHSSHEEELHYITNSLLNVDFESPCSYMDINAGCVDNAAMQIASPSETQSSNGNEDPPLSLLLPIDDNNNDNNSNNNNSYNEQTDFPLPDAPRFEDYCDYYESSNHY